MDTSRAQAAASRKERKAQSTAGSARVEAPHGFLQVGSDLYPVVGDEIHGWNIDDSDFSVRARGPGQYATLDELYFALLNLGVCGEGSA